MKKILFLCIFVISLYSISAQEKIYFDSAWTVTSKDKMVYYRELKKEAPYTRIKDFYKSGQLQMEGLALDTTPENEIFDGKVVWYYENGKINQIANYKAGKQIGEFKAYQPDGRIHSEFMYDENGKYNGTSYYYKDASGMDMSIIETVKNSLTDTKIIYDDDIKGIREEQKYWKGGDKIEYKFYGDGGKYLGTAISDESGLSGTYVLYYYNPMKVSQITVVVKKGESFIESSYFRNGKLKTDFKSGAKGDGTKTFYDKSGKLIGKIINKYNPKNGYAQPYEGKWIYYGNNEEVVTIAEYKKFKLTKESVFENGTPKKVTFHKNNEYNDIDKTIYYNADGNVKSELIYEDGIPHNGMLYEENKETNYKEGLIKSTKAFYESGKLHYQKTFNDNKKTYETTVYEKNGQKRFYIENESAETDYSKYKFTGEITIYKNGEPAEKVLVKDGILQNGKIVFNDTMGSTLQEIERNGNWLSLKIFKENELVKETKIKVNAYNLNDDDNDDGLLFYEDSLLSL